MVNNLPHRFLSAAGLVQDSKIQLANVRFGSLADIGDRKIDVRFTPKSGHRQLPLSCPLCAKGRHMQLQCSKLALIRSPRQRRQESFAAR
jgi:hypothetical protein